VSRGEDEVRMICNCEEANGIAYESGQRLSPLPPGSPFLVPSFAVSRRDRGYQVKSKSGHILKLMPGQNWEIKNKSAPRFLVIRTCEYDE
jgi:hypothetical protein